jgi:hypothetical protein
VADEDDEVGCGVEGRQDQGDQENETHHPATGYTGDVEDKGSSILIASG